jgi:hypothetical protein
MFPLGKQARSYHRPLLTNLSSDSQSTPPPPTSIEAILQHHSDAVVDESLADPRLASARHWTTVTSDTHLIVSILDSWTTREYSYYHYLDRDAFLDDMASGRTDYCSALLVNALLASACVGLPIFASIAKGLWFSLHSSPTY